MLSTAATFVLAVLVHQPEGPSFTRDVRPIISDSCFACHGPDTASNRAGLRLDRRELATEMHDGWAAIVPGSAERSELIRRIESDDPDVVMPPPESKLSLSDEQRDILRRWIDAGAAYEAHWSFVPPTDPSAPALDAWYRDEIDVHVLEAMRDAGLAPAPEAPKARWLRRVTFDLTGLPPTPEEVRAFVEDDRSDAHERVVDRLLASRHVGERLGVVWLDGARYADSYGYQIDELSPTWPYRDWVIEAFNANMPFDRFLTLQLAGDLVEGSSRSDKVATAFQRLHRMTAEGGSIPEEWRQEGVADRVNTFGTMFLGLTLECARCHDHKFDPISQREYYQLAAYFNNIDELGLYDSRHIVPTPSLLLPTTQQEKAIRDLMSRIDGLSATADADLESRFERWLDEEPEPRIPDVVGVYACDAIDASNTIANSAPAEGESAAPGHVKEGTSLELPAIVEGIRGGAIRFDGDNLLHVPGLDDVDRWTPFTVAFWMRVDEIDGGRRVVAHRTSGTDAGPLGVDLCLEGGRLDARVFRHWPGNALGVRTTDDVITPGDWHHVVWRYDGSSAAAGLSIVVDGEPAPVEVVRDRIWKTVGGGHPHSPGGRNLSFGQRFRDLGLAGGAIDEIVVIRRDVSDLESKHLFDGRAIDDALANPEMARPDLLAYFQSAFDGPSRAHEADLMAAREALVRSEDPILETLVMEEMPGRRPTSVLARGRYDAPLEPVDRGVPGALELEGHAPDDRLALAAWLTDPAHPLTARVAVNRWWQMLFGTGLVATSDDFGFQGEAPSHPELLDHLARWYIESGWDTKALLRRMVLSATYRQDSRADPHSLIIDPDNRLLSRGPSMRLTAEMLRDQALAASGLLVETVGGPSVHPYQPAGHWRSVNSMSPAFTRGEGDDLYRRSIYTVWKRTAPDPVMIAFDAPGREACAVRRPPTSSAQQVLVLLNNIQFVEAARVLAERAMLEHVGDEARVAFIFERLTSRRVRPAEMEALVLLLAEQRAIFDEDVDGAQALLEIGEHPREASLSPVDVAAFTIVSQCVLASDASIWKR